MYKFKEDFYWGAASSATQMEGAAHLDGKGENVWDAWFKMEPEKFHNGVVCEVGTDFYHHYKEDIALMKELNLNSFRTSISWSRLIPDGDGEVNEKAVEFYRDVFKTMHENGIKPFVNLYHFDMPYALHLKGGLESREVVDAYARYARICFERFGDLVDTWFTFNEPIVPVECGYLGEYHLPCVCDWKRAMQVLYNTCIAHAKAVKIYHEGYKGRIGTILNLTPSYPRSDSKEDVEAAYRSDLICNLSFLDAACKGEMNPDLVAMLKKYNVCFETCEGDEELIKAGIVDLLGVNYYQPRRIKAKDVPVKDEDVKFPWDLYDFYAMPGRKMNPYRGWEIYEKGLYDIAKNIQNNYNNIPWFVSENGMGVEDEMRFAKDGIIQDDYRIEFIAEHLKYLNQAIEEGANCVGYHLWTFIDCWSWLNSFKNRYGYVSLDLETGKRTVKKSGLWIKEVAKNHGFE